MGRTKIVHLIVPLVQAAASLLFLFLLCPSVQVGPKWHQELRMEVVIRLQITSVIKITWKPSILMK